MRDLADELLQAKVKAKLFGGGLEPSGPKLGRLVLLDRLGRGAMGTVFAAFDPQLDRRVAVKVVRDPGTDSARVLQEARALARLAHPNVVAVHDVGEIDDTIYIVMELAPGIAMRGWIGVGRDWREVLAIARQAGAGIAAAHRAGLVHRDIKPDNILIGEDRVRIVDFGLAHDRLADATTSAGTPSYMAPEVLAGEPAMPASDQFSFAVTLYEALHGRRPAAAPASAPEPVRAPLAPPIATEATAPPEPHPTPEPRDADIARRTPPPKSGESYWTGGSRSGGAESRDSNRTIASDPGELPYAPTSPARAARLPPPASAAGASPGTEPAWLHAVILRALDPDPARRFPDLDAMLAALDRDRRRYVAISFAAGGLAIVGIAAAIALRGHGSPDPCGGGAARREAVWTDAIGARITTATAPWSAAPVLADTVQRWEVAYRAVCEATRVRGDQSDRLLELRMRCLDRSLDRFGALVHALDATALDTPVRAGAISAAAQLPQPEACATVRDDGDLALPTEPAARAKAIAAEHELDRAWTLFALGRYRDAKPIAETLLAPSTPVIHAAALALAGSIEARIGDPATARARLRDALDAAAGAHAFGLSADVWARLLRTELFAGEPAHAIDWAPFAHTAATAAGLAGAELDGITGEALRDAGRLAEAATVLTRALASSDPLRPDQRSLIEMNLGSVELATGLPDEAHAAFAHARDTAARLLGDAHPELALYDDKLAAAERARGRIASALALHDRSLAARRAAFGDNDRAVATSLFHRAQTLIEAGRLAEAGTELERARAIRVAAYGEHSARLGELDAALADLVAARDREGSRTLYDRAAALDPRLALTARRLAAGLDVPLDPEVAHRLQLGLAIPIGPTATLDDLTARAIRAVALAKADPAGARSLAVPLFDAWVALANPHARTVDPQLSCAVGDAFAAIGDPRTAEIAYSAALAALADEPSRTRLRALAGLHRDTAALRAAMPELR